MSENPADRVSSPPAGARRWSDRERIIYKNGPPQLLGDLYHAWLTASWRTAILVVVLAYALANAVFALLFLWTGGIENARPGSFADAYFFSVQTLATVGYGRMAPVNVAANAVASIGAVLGVIGSALITGLLFAKLSRPTARVLFSRVAVISPYEGVPSLQFRMSNQRANRIVEATLSVSLLRQERTREGVVVRRLVDLRLLRDHSSVFALGWLAIHPIDEESPLLGQTAETLAAQEAEIFVAVTGMDETFSQTITARHAYRADDLLWNAAFVDVIEVLPDGRRAIDYALFHEVRKVDEGA
jgi:inward rectifier potassium channel